MTKTKTHDYLATVTWTGGWLDEKRTYRSYSREHVIEIAGKEPIRGSSDPSFRGDASLHNPEEMLVASLSSCHMLWYLHLCVVNGIAVASYRDQAKGIMEEFPDGSGRFTSVILRPVIAFEAGADLEKARGLHDEAHKKCFIASSMNFPVLHEPEVISASQA